LDLGTAAAPAIAFASDKNTGIYNPGADQLAISTGGTGRLFVDASGNVGLATSAPGAKLHVAAGADVALQLDANTGLNTSIALSENGSIKWYFGNLGADDSFRFYDNTAATERLRIDSSGRLGLGVSDPIEKLVVAGATANIGIYNTTAGSTASPSYSRLNFYGYLQTALWNVASISAGNSAGNTYAGTLQFATNTVGGTHTTALTIDSSQRVGIGTTSPSSGLHLANATAGSAANFTLSNPANNWSIRTGTTDNALIFAENQFSSEKARIDGSGRLLVGTSSARSNLYGGTSTQFQIEGTSFSQTTCSIVRNENLDTSVPGFVLGKTRGASNGTNTIVASGDGLGIIDFQGADGTNLIPAARISGFVDGTPGANDMPGRLVFSTTADGAASPTERMRISANGAVSIGTTGTSLGATDGVIVGPLESSFTVSTAAQVPIRIYNKDTAGTRYCMEFRSASTAVGSITHDGTNTSYTTSSDYRLKENVTVVTDGITRLQQLKPSRFNFISNPDKTVDGFIAHEAQAVVPECVTGTKDEVDDDGNPVYQGIDQSKLVPLLTAALQEAIAKIETLEARLSALEAA
jgi:hypothetical protein